MSRDYLHAGREVLEEAAVSCLLSDCPSATASGTMPDPELYGDQRRKAIAATVLSMLARREAVDAATVAGELAKRQLLEGVGGFGYLSHLLDRKAMDFMFPDYQRRLWDFVDSDASHRIVEELRARLGDEDPMSAVAEAMDGLQRQSRTAAMLTDARPLSDVLSRAVERYDRLRAGRAQGVQTGFVPIDSQGGLQPGEMVLIAGQTGVGKSTLALNILHGAIHSGEKAVVFSLEMSDQAWIDRLISLDLGVDRRVFRSRELFTEAVAGTIAANMARLRKVQIWVNDDPSATIEVIRRVTGRLAATTGVRLLVVDYAQLVAPGGEDSREQQVSAIGRGLRVVCQEFRVVGLVLSQLNDEGRIRESRALLHEAHLALVLTERVEDNKSSLWVTSPKGREMHIPDFPVEFDALTCRITQRSQVAETRNQHND